MLVFSARQFGMMGQERRATQKTRNAKNQKFLLSGFMNSWDLTPTDINSQDREIRRPDYPLAALQQIFRNAVLHRNYEGTNAPIRLYWFDDRVEIMNPGGPFGIVNAGNFGQPHIADYRNPTIAEVLHNLDFVQRFGFGIQNAKSLLKANGNPEPEFNVSASTVVVTIKKAAK